MQTDFMSSGQSWYETGIAAPPECPALAGEHRCDVVVVGGGFTGLSAAFHLAAAGVGVVVLEERRFGAGASGRNGGQLGTGQRQWVEELEKTYGFERAKALFDLAESAKPYFMDFARTAGIDMEYRSGQMSLVHKPRLLDSYRRHVDAMRRYGYEHLHFMEHDETAARLGSKRYFGGLRDMGTGHIHPLKLVLGTARAADEAGAKLYENTRVVSIEGEEGAIRVKTAHGAVTATRALIATNGYGGALEPMSAARVLPIRSFIGATEPLAADSAILRGGEAVDDSRFVVRYFRKSADNRLLFGGSEAYGHGAADMEAPLRKQMLEIYPELENIRFTHIWGGTLGITVQRLPFVRDVRRGVTFCGGYSGHGVLLSHFFGRLYAEALSGRPDRLAVMKELKISRFPGGILRSSLLFAAMHWFALRDRF
ncbi:MAG: Glycine/D-amino acid oxidase, deaminating [Candidatus Tokpelaia hoelldobleri]|uniref:Glycine/D-amino acid oxidase, deaminating n=1 Tax=Candidatus Tokpelaia hoelldobleri TaxID=1902579 RepID=A0A1U9JW90_9HYPH|nr:MAG: Glycine/D-amino acid oxidase, deaminating [Candidatus Tokpelaia hoelldoblerii]